MPLHAELDDGKRWRVCSSRARVRVRLRWTELPHPDLAPLRTVPYERRVTRWLWIPVSEAKGRLSPVEGGEAWTDAMTVQAGRFLSRQVRFQVSEGHDPPNVASIRLIPRASAVVALSLLVVSLVALAWQTAATLSTLHLNFSYSHAVTGLGGLTMLALAARAVHDVVGRIRGDGVPLYGLGFLLGRTMAAIGVGAGTLGLLLTQCVTTVENDTEANVELKLPDSPNRLVLGPGQQITFLGRRRHVGKTVLSSLADERRFCIVDERGTGLDCPPDTPAIDISGDADRPFRPARLRLRCRQSLWRIHSVEAPAMPGTFGRLLAWGGGFVGGPGTWDRRLVLDEECVPEAQAKAALAFEAGDGIQVSYELTHPWTYTQLERSSNLVIESRSVLPLRLRMTATAATETGPDDGPAALGPVLTVDIDPGERSSFALPTPYAEEVDEFSIVVGATSFEQGQVTCMRDRNGIEDHFRLIGLPTLGTESRLLELQARSTAAPSWGSRWQNLRPEFAADLMPMLCAVATGRGDEQHLPVKVPPRSLTLSLKVGFPHFGDPVALRIPAEYAARRIEITAQTDAGSVARGVLTCVLPQLDEGASYELAPVWVEDADGEPMRDVLGLEVGDEAEDTGEAAAQGGTTRCVHLYSHWTADHDVSLGGRDGWFPPWVCRPSRWSMASCVDEEGAVADSPRRVVAEVLTRQTFQAELDLGHGNARIRSMRPRGSYAPPTEP